MLKKGKENVSHKPIFASPELLKKVKNFTCWRPVKVVRFQMTLYRGQWEQRIRL
mgnify:CR=1 FL=1